MKEKFEVSGMTCSACSSHVEKAVNRLDGVDKAEVNLLTNSMWVNFDESQLNEDAIIKAVEASGYGARPAAAKGSAASGSGGSAAVSGGGTAGSASGTSGGIMEEQLSSMKKRLWISFGFLIPLMYVSMGHMMGLPLPGFLTGMENAVSYGLTQFLLCIPIVYVNQKYYQVGFKTLFRGSPNMDSLIAIGSAAALAYGIFAIYRMGYGLGTMDMALVERYHMDLYFESAATILALITLGKFLETKSKGKTSEALSRLMDLAPKTALVERSPSEVVEVPVDAVAEGDIVVVKPGSSIPVDGIIVEGSSSLDESAITGESIPVEKKTGDQVVAATINKAGFFKFRATKVGDDTTLAQIIRLMEEASSSKAPIAKLADKIAGVFVPVVIAIAVAATAIWLFLGSPFEFALSIGIAVLVISCPCALGLATPVAIMVGTGKGAENGILIKSGEALETAHSINTIVLDKTGTITEGKPRVTDVLSVESGRSKGGAFKGGASKTGSPGSPAPGAAGGYSDSQLELLKLAGSIERQSEHPLAEAVLAAAGDEKLALSDAKNFEAIFGRGAGAEIDGALCYAGNEALMQEKSIDIGSYKAEVDRLASEGKTPLLFSKNGSLTGIIAVADVVKATSKEAIASMEALGIDVIMLTGDNERTARAIQKQLGISQVIAEVLPQDKEREVARLQEVGRKVAMVGDGINDAPALARADVGIAIGAGTDVAIESADIVLMKSDLKDAVTAVRLSKAVIRNIKENLFWAFFYNSVGIPLAAGVFYNLLDWKLSPMFAAAAMSLSSVCVVTNALRLKLFKAEPRTASSPGAVSASPASATAADRSGSTADRSGSADGRSGRASLSEGPELKAAEAANVSNTTTVDTADSTAVYNKEEQTGGTAMKMKIEGMSCGHCSARVEKALNALDGVNATVDLEAGTADVSVSGTVDEAALRKAVEDAGYEVAAIE